MACVIAEWLQNAHNQRVLFNVESNNPGEVDDKVLSDNIQNRRYIPSVSTRRNLLPDGPGRQKEERLLHLNWDNNWRCPRNVFRPFTRSPHSRQ